MGAFIHFRNVLDMGWGKGRQTDNVIRWWVNTSCIEHGGLTIHRCLVLWTHITAFAQGSDLDQPSPCTFPSSGCNDNWPSRVSRKWEARSRQLCQCLLRHYFGRLS
jgi:hypothetical protein